MSFVPGSKYEVTMEVASLMPASALPCANAVALAAMRSAAERIVLILLFLFILMFYFVPSKGG